MTFYTFGHDTKKKERNLEEDCDDDVVFFVVVVVVVVVVVSGRKPPNARKETDAPRAALHRFAVVRDHPLAHLDDAEG